MGLMYVKIRFQVALFIHTRTGWQAARQTAPTHGALETLIAIAFHAMIA
jgi:hypothetical protein